MQNCEFSLYEQMFPCKKRYVYSMHFYHQYFFHVNDAICIECIYFQLISLDFAIDFAWFTNWLWIDDGWTNARTELQRDGPLDEWMYHFIENACILKKPRSNAGF